MKKKVTKKKVVSASKEVPLITSEVTSSEDAKGELASCMSCKPIDKLTGIGGNEDFNKVVAKINEIIDNHNDSI